MITVLRKLVYFGALFIALMGISMILVKNELGYVPRYISTILLALVFIIGILLIVVILRRGVDK